MPIPITLGTLALGSRLNTTFYQVPGDYSAGAKVLLLFLLPFTVRSSIFAATPWHTKGTHRTPCGEVGYRIAGDGPPLLLLHGYFGQGRQWEPFLETFSAHYTVIAPDLLGHGTSTITGENFEVAASAQALWQLLDALALSEFRAVGYSAGALQFFSEPP